MAGPFQDRILFEERDADFDEALKFGVVHDMVLPCPTMPSKPLDGHFTNRILLWIGVRTPPPAEKYRNGQKKTKVMKV